MRVDVVCRVQVVASVRLALVRHVLSAMPMHIFSGVALNTTT